MLHFLNYINKYISQLFSGVSRCYIFVIWKINKILNIILTENKNVELTMLIGETKKRQLEIYENILSEEKIEC